MASKHLYYYCTTVVRKGGSERGKWLVNWNARKGWCPSSAIPVNRLWPLFSAPSTQLRKLVIMGLDRVKRGRGPIMVRTVAGTVVVVLNSSVYSMMKIQKRGIDDGVVNSTDQVLMAKHLLEASLMGNSVGKMGLSIII